MPTVGLPTGTIHYFEYGPPDGRPVVFVHGYLMGGELFADLGRRLGARGLRCLAPTWPLGAQTEPMTPGTDLTPAGVAAMIAAFLDALDLEDVVLLGNDTGGALCQLVAADHPTRLGAVVLTNCDAFENFPPSFFKALVKAARLPGGFRAVLAPMRTAAARRSPLGFGLLSHHDVDHLAREWVRPIFERPASSRTSAASPSPWSRRSPSAPRRGCRHSSAPSCSPGRWTTSSSPSTMPSGLRRCCRMAAWSASKTAGRFR